MVRREELGVGVEFPTWVRRVGRALPSSCGKNAVGPAGTFHWCPSEPLLPELLVRLAGWWAPRSGTLSSVSAGRAVGAQPITLNTSDSDGREAGRASLAPPVSAHPLPGARTHPVPGARQEGPLGLRGQQPSPAAAALSPCEERCPEATSAAWPLTSPSSLSFSAGPWPASEPGPLHGVKVKSKVASSKSVITCSPKSQSQRGGWGGGGEGAILEGGALAAGGVNPPRGRKTPAPSLLPSDQAHPCCAPLTARGTWPCSLRTRQQPPATWT